VRQFYRLKSMCYENGRFWAVVRNRIHTIPTEVFRCVHLNIGAE